MRNLQCKKKKDYIFFGLFGRRILFRKKYQPNNKTNRNKPHVFDADDAIAFSLGQSKYTSGFSAKYTSRMPQMNKYEP